MKNQKPIKLMILISALILFAIALTACGSYTIGDSTANGNTIVDYAFMERVIADDVRVFVLENITAEERLTRMTSVTLYANGTATISNALVSSFMIPGAPFTTFSIESNELLIFQSRPGCVPEEANHDAVVRFIIIDNDTLEFLSASLPIFADVGARYVFSPDGFDIFAEMESGIEPIPYVGAAHETKRIVTAMPLPRDSMTLRSIQIGADHGMFGYGAYTLTVHYDLHDVSMEDAPGAEFERIATRLFDHIENLQAITFSVVSNLETDTEDYIYRWSISRANSDTGGGAVTSFRGAQR